MNKVKINYYFDNGLEYKEVLVPKYVSVGMSAEGDNVIEFKMDSEFYQQDIDRFFKNKKIDIHTNKVNEGYSIWIDIVEKYIRISDVPSEVFNNKPIKLYLLLENNKYKSIELRLN